MSLPASRNTSYAAGSQVKSADLNDLQDAVVAAHGIKYLCLGINNGAPDTTGNAKAGGTQQSYTTGSAAPWSTTIPIPLQVGKRIRGITLYYNNASASSISGKLIAISTTGVTTDVSGGGISAVASTGNLVTATAAMTRSVIDTEALYFYVEAGHTASKAYWIKIAYDEPAL